ncbi:MULTISPECIES: nuclease-related domain-containing protein [unclassified Bacillus (in: firmicutes)]|uniref:nuclease-related domain-containing protein n=1 Tax=unclassified Bacillus (in: firmicutes) TaxID=185979 RepID=UPI0008E461F8|nr:MULTISPECIES: nuclease-related domain-containing protein [unclassified Bacillus (in: firmicutes)]PGZ94648.1 nuclease [Bacillus sp. AFS029533]SFD63912.1 Nuclease-related domain-containing protein [Bacillus sp. UNCCL81]
MILKERTVPLTIRKLEALLRRLPKEHNQRLRIEDDFAKFKAGFHGEKSLDYHLSFFNKERYIIIQDLRLLDNEKRFFQIDTIILSPSFILIIEVKNLVGILYFDQSFNQLIRMNEGKEEAFMNPIIQVERQKRQLRSWLEQNKFMNYPIIPWVVLSNSKSIIKASSNVIQIANTVIHSDSLYRKLEELEKKLHINIFTSKEIRKLAKLLIKQNQLLDQNILEKYNISKNELLTGVICDNCKLYSMFRTKGSWYCPQCFNVSKDAHLHSLYDFYLLIGNTIKNSQLREFLHITSIYSASRLLRKLNLPSSGTKKDKTHYLDELSQQSSF